LKVPSAADMVNEVETRLHEVQLCHLQPSPQQRTQAKIGCYLARPYQGLRAEGWIVIYDKILQIKTGSRQQPYVNRAQIDRPAYGRAERDDNSRFQAGCAGTHEEQQ